MPKRGRRAPPSCRGCEPVLLPSGPDLQQAGRGRPALGWGWGTCQRRNQAGGANPGGEEQRGGQQVRDVGGEGAAPQGQPRAVATAPRVRPGRGGRARPRSRARTVTVAAARRPGAAAARTRLRAASSPRCAQVPPPGRRQRQRRRRREEPAGSSAMGPLRETKVRRSRHVGAGGGVRRRRRERGGGHCGATSGQVRAGGVAFRIGVNGGKEVVGTKGRQR